MPIYRMAEPGKFRSFEKTPFQDFERKLEDWIEANPQLLFPTERVVFIGRQTTTAFGKQLDLLGMDQSGALLVIELKRGMTPRDVVAQTLEYSAWVDSLELDELDSIAKAYAARSGREVGGVVDLYREGFLGDLGDEASPDSVEEESRVTFNTRQRMVIVAEEFSPEVAQTLHYLRTKLGIDIAGIRFGIHQMDADTLVETEIVVGRELRTAAANKAGSPAAFESPETTKERVTSEFVREQVDGLELWIKSAGLAGTEVRRQSSGSDRTVYSGGRRVFAYYFAAKWVHFFIPSPSPEERAQLSRLDERLNKVLLGPNSAAFNVATSSDMEVVRAVLHGRIALPAVPGAE